jgi:hypothetical protein
LHNSCDNDGPKNFDRKGITKMAEKLEILESELDAEDGDI